MQCVIRNRNNNIYHIGETQKLLLKKQKQQTCQSRRRKETFTETY